MEGRIDIEYDDGRTHESVDVAAEFTDWNPVPLGLDSGTRYAAVFDGAEAAALYHYKFIVDGQWALLPGLETAHDRAGNVNHFAVAKPIQSKTTSTQSQDGDNLNQKSPTGAGAFGSGYASGSTQESVPGGGQFGSPAKAAERQAPESNVFTTSGSSGSEFQDVTGFKPDNGTEARSANAAQEGLSSLQLSSEPFEVVKETTSSYGSDSGAGGYGTVGGGSASGAGNTGFDYASEFDRNPSRNFTGGSSYGYTDQTAKQPNTGYEYTESQLPEPKETITGGVGSGGGAAGFGGGAYTQPDTGYEYTEKQLLEPKEDVLEGAGELKQPSTLAYGAGSSSKGYDSSYNYKESQLDDAKEAIRGDTSGFAGSSRKPDTGYEYTESELTKPKEKVADNFATDDEYADAYEEASMPGSMPFERKVFGGQSVPGNALDTKPSEFSSRPSTSGTGGVSSGDAGEQSFYDSALEQLDEDDEADVFQETRADPSGLEEATGLPASLSDRTISKSAPDYTGETYSSGGYTGGNYAQGGESQLDESAAQKILDETPSTPTKERRVYEPESYAASYSPQNHQPIDVNTGFPIDHPEDYGPLGSQQPRNHGPSLRNHEHRRSLNRRDRDPAPPPITSQEHRNAAVIAAASKASAFAKQDVAAISGRIETNRGSQSSPPVSRGPSVRSSQGYNRSRDSGQFNHSPSSQHTPSSAPRQSTTLPQQQQQQQPLSQPQQAQYITGSSPVQAQQPQFTTDSSTAQAQQPRLAVKTGPSAGIGGGAAAVPAGTVPATTLGTNSDSISSASSDVSQLQRSQTKTKKEGRFKRLFKLH